MWPYSKKAPYYPFPLGGAVIMGSKRGAGGGGPAASAGNMPFGNITTPASIANTAAETAFAISALIPANTLSALGSAFWFECCGNFNTTGTPTLVARARVDNPAVGDIIAQSPTITLANNAISNPWTFRGGIEVRSLVAWTNMVPTWMSTTGVGTGPAAVALGGGGGSFAQSWAVDHTIFITITFGAASPSNAISLVGFQVYAFNPTSTA